MPPERHPTQKRRNLPFKPPSRASSTTAGPSKPTTKKPAQVSTTATSSRSKSAAGASRSRPSASSSKSTANRRKTNPSPPSDASDAASSSASDSDSEPRNLDRESNSADEADYILAEITHHKDPDTEDVISSEPLVPQKLLTKLLHHHFRNWKTKIAKDANAVAAKYIDVFVREAVARAAFERAEGGTGGGVGDGFLEVEDLEKMGPQLAMDF